MPKHLEVGGHAAEINGEIIAESFRVQKKQTIEWTCDFLKTYHKDFGAEIKLRFIRVAAELVELP